MSRPTTRRATAQSRANTDPDLPFPDSPGTDTSVNAVGGLTDEPDGADPVADTPNVSARELIELLGRVLADRAPAAPPAHSSASRSCKGVVHAPYLYMYTPRLWTSYFYYNLT